MIELFIFSIICATVASYQYRTIKKIDKLERRTTHKYEIIYYMLKDVMNEHRKK